MNGRWLREHRTALSISIVASAIVAVVFISDSPWWWPPWPHGELTVDTPVAIIPSIPSEPSADGDSVNSATPRICASDLHLTIPVGDTIAGFDVQNCGDGTLVCTLIPTSSWITVEPVWISTEDSPVSVAVAVDRTQLEEGATEAEIHIEGSFGETEIITVLVWSEPPEQANPSARVGQSTEPAADGATDFALGSELYGVWTSIFGGPPQSKLFRIDLATGAATQVGDVIPYTIGDIAFSPDGVLYASGGSAHASPSGAPETLLLEIDPSTAAVTEIGPFGIGHAIESLACTPGGELYGGTFWGKLAVINRSSGSATVIAEYEGWTLDGGLAAGPDGQLYGSGGGSVERIDPHTTNRERLGALSVGLRPPLDLSALAADPSSGVLCGVEQGVLFKIDLSRMTATKIGSTGMRHGATGLAFKKP